MNYSLRELKGMGVKMMNTLEALVNKYIDLTFMIQKKGEILINQKINEQLTYEQHYVLRYIYKKAAITSSELAKLLNVNKSAITALTNRLIEKGLIERKRQDNDRRVVHLSLSPSGKQLFNECQTKINELVGQVISVFDETEVQAFMTTYEKLANELDRVLLQTKGVSK